MVDPVFLAIVLIGDHASVRQFNNLSECQQLINQTVQLVGKAPMYSNFTAGCYIATKTVLESKKAPKK